MHLLRDIIYSTNAAFGSQRGALAQEFCNVIDGATNLEEAKQRALCLASSRVVAPSMKLQNT